MNKKGLFGLGNLLIYLVIALVVVLAFIFSDTFRWIVVGIGLIAISLFIVNSSAISNDKIRIFTFLGLLITGMILLLSAGNVFQSISGDYIEAPFFGTVLCDRSVGGTIESGSINLRDDIDGFTKITAPQNLEKYDVLLSQGGAGFGEDFRYTSSVCDKNGNSCTNIQAEVIPDFGLFDRVIQTNVPREKFVFVTIERRSFFGSWDKVDEGTYKLRYQPYNLFVQNSLEGGKNPLSGSIDCKYPVGDLKNDAILSTTIRDSSGKSLEDVIPLYRNYLEPNEAYNFRAGTVTRASYGNTVTYNGKTGYCAENIQGIGAVIYNIGELKTLTNTYRVVDTSSELARLGTDGCCVEDRVQGNRVCNDFEWETIVIEEDPDTGEIGTNVECSFIKPCNSGRFILGEGTKTYEWDCVDGKCEVSDIEEEDCVTNTDCKGDNEICVNYKCEQPSNICGDGTCAGLETKQNCEADCGKLVDELKCSIFEKKVLVTETSCGLKCWSLKVGTLGFLDTTEELEYEDCVTSGWVIITLAFILIGGLGAYTIYLTTGKRGKKRK